MTSPASPSVLRISPRELFNLMQDSAISKLLVDARHTDCFQHGCIRNAVNIGCPGQQAEAAEASASPITNLAGHEQNAILLSTVTEVQHLKELKCLRLAWDVKDATLTNNVNSSDSTINASTDPHALLCDLKECKDWNHRGLLFKKVVLYDDHGTTDGPAQHIAQILIQEGKVLPQNVFVLEGGFVHFVATYGFLLSSKTQKIKALDGMLPTEVVDRFLFLGSYENAKTRAHLRALGITHILNMADELENPFPDDQALTYKRCGVNDTAKDNIASFFKDALDWIDRAKQNPNNRVLVHCAMGISRSSAMVIAWMMKSNHWTFNQARDFVKSQRCTIKPNEGFVAQLLLFEKELFPEQ